MEGNVSEKTFLYLSGMVKLVETFFILLFKSYIYFTYSICNGTKY